MTRERWLAGAVALGAAVLSSSSVQAEKRVFIGSLCNPATPADASKIRYVPEQGVVNISTTTANVECGGSLRHNTNITRIIANFSNSHSSMQFCCTLRAQNISGSVAASQVKCTGPVGGAAVFWNVPAGTYALASIQCSIPPVQGNARSYLTSFEVDSQ